MAAFSIRDARRLDPGTEVDVLVKYQPHWAPGFQVEALEGDDRYLLRRRSDGSVLPTAFNAARVRPTAQT